MVGDAFFLKKIIINCSIKLSINNGFCTSNYPASQQPVATRIGQELKARLETEKIGQSGLSNQIVWFSR
jgi:hypothetical protein